MLTWSFCFCLKSFYLLIILVLCLDLYCKSIYHRKLNQSDKNSFKIFWALIFKKNRCIAFFANNMTSLERYFVITTYSYLNFSEIYFAIFQTLQNLLIILRKTIFRFHVQNFSPKQYSILLLLILKILHIQCRYFLNFRLY